MVLPVAALRAKYREMAELFITEINGGEITLHYNPQTNLATPSTNFDDRPRILDEYGGRVPLDTLTDRNEEAGENLYVNTNSETILCRIYWEPKKYTQDGILIDTVDKCKIITYWSNENKLRSAVKGVVNGYDVKMCNPPIPYGLFGKYFCISYWEKI